MKERVDRGTVKCLGVVWMRCKERQEKMGSSDRQQPNHSERRATPEFAPPAEPKPCISSPANGLGRAPQRSLGRVLEWKSASKEHACMHTAPSLRPVTEPDDAGLHGLVDR
jgi:hypothetical protein